MVCAFYLKGRRDSGAPAIGRQSVNTFSLSMPESENEFCSNYGYQNRKTNAAVSTVTVVEKRKPWHLGLPELKNEFLSIYGYQSRKTNIIVSTYTGVRKRILLYLRLPESR